MRRLSAIPLDKFYMDSFTLTLSNMATGIISFIFSIVLSRELGAEGLGLYGLVMPVYGLLLCITTDGLITAISKTTTLYFHRKEYRNLKRTVSTAFLFVAAWSTCVALLVLVCHSFIAEHIVKDPRAAGAIMIISPALIFVPLSAVIKGYFYGLGQYKVTASVDILEKFLRVSILLGAVLLLSPGSDVSKTVTIAYFALAIGEAVSLLLLFICYKIRNSQLKGNIGKSISRIQLIFDVFVISVPLCVEGVISSIISALSALVLPHRLVAAGFTYSDALALIGRFAGMALNITTLPYIIIGSMLTVLVTELSPGISKRDYWSAEERIAQILRISGIIGISTALVCLRIPDTLGLVFYKRNDLGEMIRFGALIRLVMFISMPTFGILNALGRQNTLLKNSLINSAQSLLLIFLLAGIPVLNIYGYGLSVILTSIASFILNIREIKKVCEIKVTLQDVVTLALMGTAVWLASGIVMNLLGGASPVILASCIVITCFGGMFCMYRLTFRHREGS